MKKYYPLLLITLFQGCTNSQLHTTDADTHIEDVSSNVFFDDFYYSDKKQFHKNGWKTRTETGHPGIKGAKWTNDTISVSNTNKRKTKGVLTLTAHTNGVAEQTEQAQVCHSRKYYEGTYAARVYFRNKPVIGKDGDQMVQTFYAISPIKAPMDIDYSEADFEYLANGGWGKGKHALWSTTWETFQLEPWIAVSENTTIIKRLRGWHTLVLQISNNTVRYYIDGKLFSTHSGEVYPEETMSINFNLWFIPNGQIDSNELREYQHDIDWVYFQADTVLSDKQIKQRVTDLRKQGVDFTDSVPENTPFLPSPCGL